MEESAQFPVPNAEAIAGNPRLWRALLFAHTANHSGTCHTCLGVRWPCSPRAAAERAEQIYNGTRVSRPGQAS